MFPEDMTAVFTAPNLAVEEANGKFEPLVSFARNVTSGAVSYDAPTYAGFIDWWKSNFRGGPSQVGGNTEVASRLLPRTLAKERPEEIATVALALGGFAAK